MLEVESELSGPGAHFDGDVIARGRTAEKRQGQDEMPGHLSQPVPCPLYRTASLISQWKAMCGHSRPTFTGLIIWTREWGSVSTLRCEVSEDN